MKRMPVLPIMIIAVLCATVAPIRSVSLAQAAAVSAQAVALYQAGLAEKSTNPTVALKDFERAAKLAPAWEPPVYAAGALLAGSNFQAALPLLMRALRLNPQDDTVWNIIGWGYYMRRNFRAAEAAFRNQLTLAPHNPYGEWGLANCYADSSVRQFSLARTILLRLADGSPLRTLSERLLAQLPPDAVDTTLDPAASVSYEDAIAIALSYHSNILAANAVPVRAADGQAPSAAVAPYVWFAAAHGDLKGLSIPSFTAPAPRLWIALLLARLYGINQFDYTRPFALTDLTGVSVDDSMYINSMLAMKIMGTVAPGIFAPNAPMTRAAYGALIAHANSVMAKPPLPAQWLTPPAPTPVSRPFIYFFSTSSPALTAQDAELTANRANISAVGFTAYPFIADFPSGSARTREAIDHTQYLLTALSAGAATVAELKLTQEGGMRPFLVLANYNNVTNQPNPQIVDQLLANTAARSGLVNEVARIVAAEGLAGVTVDFENIWPKDRQVYATFMGQLHKALQAEGALTMVCLPERVKSTGGQSPYDYAALAKQADLVMLITYDEHTPNSGPGPIATLSNDQRVVQYALQQMPADKILLGAADYGYNWSGGGAQEISMAQADALAQTHGARVTLDPSSYSATFSYHSKAGTLHTVWFENSRSIAAVARLVQRFGLRGLAVWHLGSEDPHFWSALRSVFPGLTPPD